MPFQVRPATLADLPTIADIGREAFRPAIGQIMFPPHLSHRTMENTDPAAEGGPFIDPLAFQLKILEKRLQKTTTIVLVETKDGDVQDEGEIVGYAHWEVPKSSPFAPALDASEDDKTKKEDDELKPVPPTFDRDASRRIGEEFDAETKKVLGEDGYKDMWYLGVLGVRPSHQRKGVGKKLLQWGMERAVEENKPVFLLSSPDGYQLYLSQGFRTLNEFMLCGTLPSFSMILSPSAPTDGAVSV